MNNKSGSEPDYPDYPTVDVSSLTDKIEHLQKLCEEQKGEIERLNKLIATEFQYSDEEMLDMVSACKMKSEEIEKIQSQLAEKEREIERLKNGVALLSVSANTIRDAYDNGLNEDLKTTIKYKDAYIKQLESQLAEQTERVRVMREALERVLATCCDLEDAGTACAVELECKDIAKQALNQDSLGDGR